MLWMPVISIETLNQWKLFKQHLPAEKKKKKQPRKQRKWKCQTRLSCLLWESVLVWPSGWCVCTPPCLISFPFHGGEDWDKVEFSSTLWQMWVCSLFWASEFGEVAVGIIDINQWLSSSVPEGEPGRSLCSAWFSPSDWFWCTFLSFVFIWT